MSKRDQIALLPKGESESSTELKSWAVVELFGHQRIVGFLSQQTFCTGVLFRVDVPDLTKQQDGSLTKTVVHQGFTRYFGLRGDLQHHAGLGRDRSNSPAFD